MAKTRLDLTVDEIARFLELCQSEPGRFGYLETFIREIGDSLLRRGTIRIDMLRLHGDQIAARDLDLAISESTSIYRPIPPAPHVDELAPKILNMPARPAE